MGKVNRIKTGYMGVRYVEGQNGIRIYYGRFRRNGKEIEEKLGTSAEKMTPKKAYDKLADIRSGKQETRAQKKRAAKERMTIDQIWTTYKENKTVKGLRTDQNRYDNYILPDFGNKLPVDLVPLDVERLRRKLEKLGKEPGTIKNVLELLRRICNYDKKKQLNKATGFITFTIEMPPVDNERTENLDEEQAQALLKAIEADDHAQAGDMMKVALLTGLRRGELFRLQWDDIDFDRCTITLRTTKSGKEKHIPLTDAVAKVLREHAAKAERKRAEKNPPKWAYSDFVFPGRSGGQRTDINKAVNQIKTAAGLPKSFRPLHGLRHSFASALAASGEVDILTISKLMTHGSTKVTERYAHLRNEALKKSADIAGNLFKKRSA